MSQDIRHIVWSFPLLVTIIFTTTALFMNFSNNTYIYNSTRMQDIFLIAWAALFTISFMVAVLLSREIRVSE